MSQTVDLDQISSTRVEAARDTLLALLAEQRPDLDLNAASALRKLLVDPASLLSALNQEDLDRLGSSWSLKLVSEDPDGADDDLVDQILANYLITRTAGLRAAGRVVVVVSAYVTTPLSGNTRFTSNGVVYAPLLPYLGVVSTESVLSDADRLMTARSDGYYSFLVDVQAVEPGAATEAKKDATFTVSPSIPNLVRVYAEDDFSGGTDTESNADLITRLAAGISARSLADRLSIESVIRESFPSTRHVSIIGAGDPEMSRRTFGGIALGGYVDVYVRSSELPPLTKFAMEATLDDAATQTWRVSIGRDLMPGFYRVEAVLPENDSSLGTLEITYEYDGFDVEDRFDGLFYPYMEAVHQGAFSRYQTQSIKFVDPATPTAALTEGSSKKTYDVYIRGAADIGNMQDTIFSNRSRKDPGTDYLVRAAIPCFVSVGLVIKHRPEYTAPDVREIQLAVADAVNRVDFSEARLSASHIVDAVHDIVSRTGYVDFPVDMRGTIVLPDRTELYIHDTDGLEIPDRVDLGVSRRTTAYYLHPDDVSVQIDTASTRFV